MDPLESQHSQSLLLMMGEDSPPSEPLASGSLPSESYGAAAYAVSFASTSASAQESQSQEATDFAQSLQKELQAQKLKTTVTIENLILGILDHLVENRPPMLERPRLLSNSRDIRKALKNPGLTTKIVFGKRSHRTFSMQVYVMSLVYRMIQQKQTSTLRDLYYENMNFFGNQSRLTSAVKELSLMLKVSIHNEWILILA